MLVLWWRGTCGVAVTPRVRWMMRRGPETPNSLLPHALFDAMTRAGRDSLREGLASEGRSEGTTTVIENQIDNQGWRW